MVYYTDVFDEELGAIDIYRRYPLLKPFVGSSYADDGPRILLVAESHYLPPESTVHLNAKVWYEGGEVDLTATEQQWMRTRRILNKPLKGWKSKGHAIYRNLETALIKAGLPANDSVFRQVAFMNAFQRPAKTGDSIKSTPLDVEIAAATVQQVIDVLCPEHVIFVSTKARRAVAKHLDCPSVGVHHPASPWWNRKQKGLSSRERFVGLVSAYWNSKGINQ